MTRSLSRRELLAAGAGAAGYFFLAPAYSAARTAGANERLRFAGIGVGGKGRGDVSQVGQLGDVVALCDIDESNLDAKAKEFPKAEKFYDFRLMLDKLAKQIDAVTVSTPDHTHAVAAAMAMQLGKHVYCQKPLTRTVYEAHALRNIARKQGVCTQMGNQGTTLPGLRRAVELVQAGVLGPVKEAHVWTNRPIWPQAPLVTKRPPDAPVPSSVHWDEWIGPAAFRPYAVYPQSIKVARREITKPYHPWSWRGWWDFGTGAIGDMACHTANMAFMALRLTQPTRVSAEAGDVNPETCPSYVHAILEFPARGELPPVKVHWYEGRKNGQKVTPPQELLAKVLKDGETLADSGSMMVGEKAILFSPNDNGAVFRLVGDVPDKLNVTKPEKLPAFEGPSDPNHKKEWVEAIKAGKPALALSNFDYAALLASSFLLANVAVRAGRPIAWNAETLTASGAPGVAALIKPEYRKGWELPQA